MKTGARFGPAAEKRTTQKIIVLCAGIPAIATFIVPALDRRFGWSNVPVWLSVSGDLLILGGMWMVSRVFKANSFGSATVEIANDQKVISTGPYAIVRNPMYASAVSVPHWGTLGARFLLGADCRRCSQSLASSGGSSTKKSSSLKICQAIRNIAPKCIGT